MWWSATQSRTTRVSQPFPWQPGPQSHGRLSLIYRSRHGAVHFRTSCRMTAWQCCGSWALDTSGFSHNQSTGLTDRMHVNAATGCTHARHFFDTASLARSWACLHALKASCCEGIWSRGALLQLQTHLQCGAHHSEATALILQASFLTSWTPSLRRQWWAPRWR